LRVDCHHSAFAHVAVFILVDTNKSRASILGGSGRRASRQRHGNQCGPNKNVAFVISGFIVGIAGALIGFTSRLANPEAFALHLSIDYIAMIIVGGLGSWIGSLIGAAFVVLLPEAIQRLGEGLHMADLVFAMREMAF